MGPVRGKRGKHGKERAWKKKVWRSEKENTGRSGRNNSVRRGYLNRNKVHDIRRSRYGNENEGKDVRMDGCPFIFTISLCFMHKIGFYAIRERDRSFTRGFYAGNLVHGRQINVNEGY